MQCVFIEDELGHAFQGETTGAESYTLFIPAADRPRGCFHSIQINSDEVEFSAAKIRHVGGERGGAKTAADKAVAELWEGWGQPGASRGSEKWGLSL